MSFADLGLSDQLLRAIGDSGYDVPTPIQKGAIPSVLMGKDLIGIAQTGTGKTAGFVLPMIDILAEGRSRARMPRSLILEPTRELAAQVAENFEKYGKYHKLSMALLIGGVQMGDQVKALEKGVDVLIATPGRLMDLFSRGKIMLNDCSLLVIDEADRMLDMGFIPDIEDICTKLPKQRQTLLFSATMPPPIKKLADKFLTDPKTIEVARPATANVNIEQRLVVTRGDKKRDVLRTILRSEEFKNAIIFCNKKTTVRELYIILEPPATAEVVDWMNLITLSGSAYDDGSSFFVNNVGKQVVGTNFTLADDALDPDFLPFPFDLEGLPKRRVALIERGIVRTPAVDKVYADRLHFPPTATCWNLGGTEHGSAFHLSIDGGDATREELIRSTKHGIWVTRFNYVNGLLEPKTALMTGTTRDGTFLIRDGEVVARLPNLRWTQRSSKRSRASKA